jgi:hypothetical protein
LSLPAAGEGVHVPKIETDRRERLGIALDEIHDCVEFDLGPRPAISMAML